MDDLIRIVSELGFPISVAAYVLVRLNGKMDKLVTALNELGQTIKDENRETSAAVSSSAISAAHTADAAQAAAAAAAAILEYVSRKS